VNAKVTFPGEMRENRTENATYPDLYSSAVLNEFGHGLGHSLSYASLYGYGGFEE
jgi:hypothetical protein